MIKELVTDEAFLSQPSDEATIEDDQIAQDLTDTLVSTEDGACLAANQIGSTKAIIAYLDDDDNPHVMFNPKLKRGLGAFKTLEGCLSREDESKVTRYRRIKVAYDELSEDELLPREVDLRGWTAQIVQHSIDHCKGKLV